MERVMSYTIPSTKTASLLNKYKVPVGAGYVCLQYNYKNYPSKCSPQGNNFMQNFERITSIYHQNYFEYMLVDDYDLYKTSIAGSWYGNFAFYPCIQTNDSNRDEGPILTRVIKEYL